MKLTLVVPVFNEEKTLFLFYKAVRSFNEFNNYKVELVFIDDGSSDKTLEILNQIYLNDNLVSLISFSRNFGKEAALLAGLKHSNGDVVIPIDVDLQDPLITIPFLIKKWEAGYDVVLAKRVDRKNDTLAKRLSASVFYKLNNIIAEIPLEENVGDFRLMSAEVVNTITQLPERNLYMKGLFSWVGYKTAVVEYKREKRISGKTKFNLNSLLNLAINGITSFSTFPLRLWMYIGLLISFISFSYGFWLIIDKLVWGNPVSGYPSIMTGILFLGGIQLISIGVLGEYIGRIFIETKQRPRYIIRSAKFPKN